MKNIIYPCLRVCLAIFFAIPFTISLLSQQLQVLPSDGSVSQEVAPQGGLRYQRHFYLLTPEELSQSLLGNGTTINSIGFTIAAAQSDTTRGSLKVYLQNTTDAESRQDTTWTVLSTNTTSVTLSGLIPGNYEWQVQADCPSGASNFTTSTNFVTAAPGDCNPAANLSATNATDQSVTLNWTAPFSTNFTDYLVEYSIAGTENWLSSTTTAQTLEITGLSPGNIYQWRVKTLCSNGVAAVAGASFVTENTSVCNPPSNLMVGSTTETTANLSWTADASATRHDIQYRPLGTSAWLFTISFSNTVNLAALLPGTTYEWRVKTICSSGSGAYTAGPPFNTTGETNCLPPIGLATAVLSDTSATLSWANRSGATSYTIRYRLRESIRWENAIAGMALVHADNVLIPDTIGPFNIPFSGPNIEVFNYAGNGLYIAWEYTNAAGPLSSNNSILATAQNTRIRGIFGQDSLRILLSLVAKNDANILNHQTFLSGTDLRPATRLGSDALVDVVSVETIHALGYTAPPFSTPSPIAAVVKNWSATPINTPVNLTIKDKDSGAIRFSDTQNLSIGANASQLVSFASWIPSVEETDSIIVTIPAQPDEHITGNNTSAYVQQVNASIIAYDDGSTAVTHAGFGAESGLILARFGMNGCGKVNGTEIYLDASAANHALYAVLLDGNGNRVDSSAVFTPDSTQVDQYHAFYFPNVPAFSNSFFYVGLAQMADPTDPYFPVGVQWETAYIQDSAYFRADLDGANLRQQSLPGRLMIMAEVLPGLASPLITGDESLCQGSSGLLQVGSISSRFANEVIRVSSAFSNVDFNGNQSLGTPDLYPAYGPNPSQWVSQSADGQREYIELGFPNPAPINIINIYETFNPGAIDTIYVKNPNTGAFEVVYVDSAFAAPPVARIQQIEFPLTAFDVAQIRLAINSPAVFGFNGIDAVSIGQKTVASTYDSYAWSTGATSSSITISATGTYSVSVTDTNGCVGATSISIRNPNETQPTISIAPTQSTTFCEGEMITLTSSESTGNTWNTGETTQSIIVNSSGTYFVTFDDGNGCGLSTSDSVIVTVNPLPSISLPSATAICPGETATLTAGSGFTSYAWSTGEAGASIIVSAADTYTVTVTDANGCSNSASTVAFFTPAPTPTIQGHPFFCPGSSTMLDAGSGFSQYNWSNGATTQVIEVVEAGLYGVTVVDANGCSGNTSMEVVALSAPNPVIAGSLSFCAGNTTTLDVGIGFVSYLWSTGETSHAIIADTVQTYSVTVTDGNGCTGTTSATTTLNGELPVSPGPITGPTIGLCQTEGNVYSIEPVPNTTHYVWTVPEGDTIISGQGSTSITVNFNQLSTGLIIVAASNACGQSPSISPTTLSVQGTPAAPGPISGPTTGLCHTQGNTYSIPAVGAASSYQWSVPAGASITSGQGTTSITVAFGALTTGSIGVTAINDCGGNAVAQTDQLVVEGAPSILAGRDIVVSNNTYTIAPVSGATSYLWESPSGTTIISGQGSNAITLSISDNFLTGVVCITPQNDCGEGQAICVEVPLNARLSSCQAAYIGYAPAECVTLEADAYGGTAPYTYAWSNGETSASIEVCPSETSNYSLSITDANGMTITKETEVEVYDIRCGVYNTFVEVCRVSGLSNTKRTLCVTQSRVSYYLDQGGYLGQCEQIVCAPTPAGISENRLNPSFIDQIGGGNSLLVFPNPAGEELELRFTVLIPEAVHLQVFDAKGQLLKQVALTIEEGENHYTLPLTDLAAGMYFIQLNGKNTVLQSRFVKL
ncbi:MAG: fibronectin type III domain-containing protein [Saprospiraceae bacterium]